MKKTELLEDVGALLREIPGWSAMSAREQTKLCCKELLRRGVSPPGWEGIRQILGKGGATDINRGKREFFEENARLYASLQGMVPGVPEKLGGHVLAFWNESRALASAEYDEQVAQWQTALAKADDSLLVAEAERDRAVAQVKMLEDKILGLQNQQSGLQEQLRAEAGAREQAERNVVAIQQALAQQRSDFKIALERSHDEVRAAIERLEGVERHSLREIERARAEARLKVEEIRNIGNRERVALEEQLSEERALKNSLQRELMSVNAKLGQSRDDVISIKRALDEKEKSLAILRTTYESETKKLRSGRQFRYNSPTPFRGSLQQRHLKRR